MVLHLRSEEFFDRRCGSVVLGIAIVIVRSAGIIDVVIVVGSVRVIEKA